MSQSFDGMKEIISFNRQSGAGAASINNTQSSSIGNTTSVLTYVGSGILTETPFPTFFPNNNTNLQISGSTANINLIIVSFQYNSSKTPFGNLYFSVFRNSSPMTGLTLSGINLATNSTTEVNGTNSLYLNTYAATASVPLVSGTAQIQIIDNVNKYNNGNYYYSIRVFTPQDTSIEYHNISLSCTQLQ
jgi:hypothetical protein